jgi:hypothetical protein
MGYKQVRSFCILSTSLLGDAIGVVTAPDGRAILEGGLIAAILQVYSLSRMERKYISWNDFIPSPLSLCVPHMRAMDCIVGVAIFGS